MDATEKDERKRFVSAALDYIGTPYHHMGRVKGAGVDCATLLICAAQDAGLIGHVDLPYYAPQWHLHRGSEQYLATISTWCVEVSPPPLPGDVVLWRFGRSFSHAAIVVDWPKIVHAYIGRPVGLSDAIAQQNLQFIGEQGPDSGKPRPMKIMSRWSR